MVKRARLVSAAVETGEHSARQAPIADQVLTTCVAWRRKSRDLPTEPVQWAAFSPAIAQVRFMLQVEAASILPTVSALPKHQTASTSLWFARFMAMASGLGAVRMLTTPAGTSEVWTI